MNKHFSLITYSFSVALVILIALMGSFDFFQKFEYIVFDSFFNLRGNKVGTEEIIIIEIDEKSLDHFGPWPWSRDLIALLISTLNEYSPKMICLDVFFSEKFPLTDFFVIQAMKERKNVCLPLIFEDPPHPASPKEMALLKETKDNVDINEFYSKLVKDQNPKIGNIVSNQLIDPHLEIYNECYIPGHGHAIPDMDGIIRRIPSFIHHKNYSIPQFALHALAELLKCSVSNAKVLKNNILWIPDKTDLPNAKKGIHIPINKRGEIPVNWLGKWGESFKHYSVRDILVSREMIKKGEKPLLPLDNILRGKICLSGLTALGLIDIKPMPLDKNYPMLGVHANLMNSIIQNDYLKEISLFKKKCCAVLYPLLVLLVFYYFREKLHFILFFISIGLWPFIGYFSFIYLKIFIPVVIPMLSVLSTFLVTLGGHFLYQRYEASKLMIQAITDELTQMYTHRYFKFKMQELFMTKYYLTHPFSLLLLDIDNFKHINDTYGHENGNVVLKGVADILKKQGDSSEVINCRYGGEEFCILLLNHNKNEACKYAEKLLKNIRDNIFSLSQRKVHVTVSIGLASLPGVICDGPDQFLQAVDSSMYYAKKNGKDQVQYFQQNHYMYNQASPKKLGDQFNDDIKNPSTLEYLSLDLRKRNEELETIIRQMQEMQNEILEHEKEMAIRKLGAYISHELNKPIHNIRNCLGIIRNEIPDNNTVMEFAGLAHDEIERVANLSRQMLDFYRPAGRKEAVHHVNHLLKSIIRISEKQFHDKEMKIVFESDESLPSLICSGEELKQVFLNLIMNAYDAMDAGGNLLIRTAKAKDKIQIHFIDDGKGISREIQDRIFDPFFSTKEQKGGTGLGLAVSYNIVKKYNGTIVVKSKEGNGTTFLVSFPIE